MSTPSRVAVTLSLAVLLGGGGYWAGTNNLVSMVGFDPVETALATPAAPGSVPTGAGAVVYYRHPDGLPQFSATSKTTEDGRPFSAVHASEDVRFDDKAKAPAPAPAPASTSAPAADGRILYYRNPMGLPDTSKVHGYPWACGDRACGRGVDQKSLLPLKHAGIHIRRALRARRHRSVGHEATKHGINSMRGQLRASV